MTATQEAIHQLHLAAAQGNQVQQVSVCRGHLRILLNAYVGLQQQLARSDGRLGQLLTHWAEERIDRGLFGDLPLFAGLEVGPTGMRSAQPPAGEAKRDSSAAAAPPGRRRRGPGSLQQRTIAPPTGD